MRKTAIIMGMPITIEIIDRNIEEDIMEHVFDYFRSIDKRFSPYKKNSELSKINRGLNSKKWSKEMREVLDLCQETSELSNGYFNITKFGYIDPSGLVKGWSILNASKLLNNANAHNFYIEAGGDIQVNGDFNDSTSGWQIGIRNPFNTGEVVKIIRLKDKGIATSGTYIRGSHIYNPLNEYSEIKEIASLSIIGPNVYEADRFATAAFAMGSEAINYIEQLEEFEGYMIDNNGIATLTSGFDSYLEINNA